MRKQTVRQALISSNGQIVGFLPKRFRSPFGNIEYGPKDKDGIRHVQGIGRIVQLRFSADKLDMISELSPDFLAISEAAEK